MTMHEGDAHARSASSWEDDWTSDAAPVKPAGNGAPGPTADGTGDPLAAFPSESDDERHAVVARGAFVARSTSDVLPEDARQKSEPADRLLLRTARDPSRSLTSGASSRYWRPAVAGVTVILISLIGWLQFRPAADPPTAAEPSPTAATTLADTSPSGLLPGATADPAPARNFDSDIPAPAVPPDETSGAATTEEPSERREPTDARATPRTELAASRGGSSDSMAASPGVPGATETQVERVRPSASPAREPEPSAINTSSPTLAASAGTAPVLDEFVTPAPALAAPVDAAPRPPEPEPVAAAPPTAPVPANPAPAPLSDRQQIGAVIEQYRAAFSARDAGAARAVWPDVNVSALERAFGQLASQDLSFAACSVSIDDVRATASCSGSITYATNIGNRGTFTDHRSWHFALRKTGQRWLIAGVDSR